MIPFFLLGIISAPTSPNTGKSHLSVGVKHDPFTPYKHRQHRHVITITVFFQTSSIYLIPAVRWLHDAPFDVGGIKTVSRKELKRQQCGVCLFIKFFIFTKSRSSAAPQGFPDPFSILATIAVFWGKVCQRRHMTSRGGTLSRAGRS